MAEYKAISAGNWSTLALWEDNSSGSFAASTSLPSTNDDVYANGFVVQIDQTISVKSLRAHPNTTLGINTVLYNRFEISSDITVTTSEGIYGSNLYTSPIIDIKTCILIKSVCNPIINSNIYACNTTLFPGNNTYQTSLCINAAANVTIIGDIYGANVGNAPAIYCAVPATINVIGNLYGGVSSISFAIYASDGYFEITGNIYGGNSASLTGALSLFGSAVSKITGNLYGSVSPALCTSAYGATNEVIGNLYASTVPAYWGMQTSQTNNLSILIITGNLFNNLSVNAAFAAKIYYNVTPTTVWEFSDFDGDTQYLYGAGVNTGHPIEANVKKDTIYGPNDEFEGTLAVPPVESVVKNVPVDDTVGTYELTPEAIEHILELQNPKKVLGSGIIAYQ